MPRTGNSGLSGQMFMIGIKGFSLSPEERDLILSRNIGFVILFSRNFASPRQFKKLTREIHSLGKIPPAIFIDQEGGPVVRLGETGGTVISHMGLAATGDIRNSESAGRIIGKEMKSLGVDGVFAPVLDVNSAKENPVIGIRSFSDDPSMVSACAAEFFSGLRRSGVIACGKHFPGHGHTIEDSHFGIPDSVIDEGFLRRINLPPFSRLIQKGIGSLMTAHVRFPLISPEVATFSNYFTRRLLREEMKFHGVLFSDCMEMKSVRDNFKISEIIEGVLESSVDVISVSHSIRFQTDLIDSLAETLRKDTFLTERIEASVRRINALKSGIRPAGFLTRFLPVRLRKNKRKEMKIADASTTVLKNERGLLPMERDCSVLIIDAKKKVHSVNMGNVPDMDLIEESGRRYFPRLKYTRLPESLTFSEPELKEIDISEFVILVDHSWSSRMDPELRAIMNELIGLRDDLILVCANSPFVAESFPAAGTIVLTYGLRQVQSESLFRCLSGKIKPEGRLPVRLNGFAG
jgi:beta-N-acetylhexosaminidase